MKLNGTYAKNCREHFQILRHSLPTSSLKLCQIHLPLKLVNGNPLLKQNMPPFSQPPFKQM